MLEHSSFEASFQAIVHEVMLEEPTPSYEALVRWQLRYPKYRDSLAEYFADWAMDCELPSSETEAGTEAEIDEVALVEKGVDYAMDMLRRQDGFIPKDSVAKLAPIDQLVLAAVVLLRDSARTITIVHKVSEINGKQASLGAMYTSLDRLERKGLIESRSANPETEPKLKGRPFFVATMAGERALAYARATSRAEDGFLGSPA
jgi:PadR family transcriptional regulator PadR